YCAKRPPVRTIRWAPHSPTPVNSRGEGREAGEFERFGGLSRLTVPPTGGARGCGSVADHRSNPRPVRALRRAPGNPSQAPSRRGFSPLASSNGEVAPHNTED